MRARGSQIAPKIIAERRAEKFLVDLFVGGKGTALNTLHVGKLLDPVKPTLSLPEAIDGGRQTALRRCRRSLRLGIYR
jgi:hypothetical protein